MNLVAKRSILLSPHIDDVPLSVGGCLLDGRFPFATVLNVFSISRSAYNDDDAERVTAARRLEDDRFFQLMGLPVERHYLDRLDAPIRLGITDEDVCATPLSLKDSEEIACIRKALDAIRSSDSLLVAPLGLGKHIDHLVVRRTAIAAARDGWSVAFYEDCPYAADLSFEAIQSVVDESSAELGRHLKPQIFPFGPAGHSKEGAIKVYQSQLGPTTVARVLVHSMRLGDGAERLWL